MVYFKIIFLPQNTHLFSQTTYDAGNTFSSDAFYIFMLIIIDREPRGASLAEKVTNFYACSSDLHTLS